jgi:hypothetical protein
VGVGVLLPARFRPSLVCLKAHQAVAKVSSVDAKFTLITSALIQPLVWRIHQAAVTQIESINVNVEGHSKRTVKEQGAPLRTVLLPNHRSSWGDIQSNIGPKAPIDNRDPQFLNYRSLTDIFGLIITLKKNSAEVTMQLVELDIERVG